MMGRPKGSKDKSKEAHINRCEGHKGHKTSHWKGGKSIRRGYILIWCPTHPNNRLGYVYEHRLVMEKHLGRTLSSKEVVHHINQNISDNRIENLMVFEDSGKHLLFHRRRKSMQLDNKDKYYKGETK